MLEDPSSLKFTLWAYDSSGNAMSFAHYGETLSEVEFGFIPGLVYGNYSSSTDLFSAPSDWQKLFTIEPEDNESITPTNLTISFDFPSASEMASYPASVYSNGTIYFSLVVMFGTDIKGATINISTDGITGLT